MIRKNILQLLCWLLTITLISCINYNNFYTGIAAFRAHDYRAAFIRLKSEAEHGQPDAQYAIGYMYYYGQGVVENRSKAWYWITQAAKLGQPEAKQAVRLLKSATK